MISLLKRFLFFVCTIAFLWSAGFVWFITTIPSAPSQNTDSTDAIVVLTGGGLRLERGVELLIAGKAKLLFISGVEDGITLPALLRKKELSGLADKVPVDRVELGYYAHSTFQNAEETAFWVRKHNIKSLRLVTGNYHMPRSLYELRETMPGILIIPDPVFPAEFSSPDWWLSAPGIRLVLSEYHKCMASVALHVLGIISEENSPAPNSAL